MGIKIALYAIAVYALIGCSSDAPEGTDYIPDIPIECDSGVVADCINPGKTAYVGLISSLVVSCEDFLNNLNDLQRRQSFAAYGSTNTTRSGGLLIGTVSTWENESGGRINAMESGSYQVCAFIDTNSNDRIDLNEPVGTGTVTLGQNSFILSTWSAAF